ncbi:hypothetical protein D6D00_07539 [Aureobasidium pullulans]|uniref:Mitochondrial carrier n=1 Tax=Aureobasidium pullulans TaxID=5580 RepID=A0A4S8SLW6_AURPU|nr:hypothetical protein D6D28_04161 [Aureobasidium pullulans]THY20983.1 hypothetical protein D6D00_07539 [Aureobasidium pullulans]
MAHPVQLTTSRDTPNPLRPYYRPPSIGLPPPDANATSSATGASSSLGSSARDAFNDLDYSSFLSDGDSASVADMGRKVLDQALWKYTSVLLAQPFDVAKTILQVRLATQLDAESTLRRRTSARFAVDQYPPSEDESDPDEPSYFTPTKPTRANESDRSRSRRPRTPPSRDSRDQSPAPHVLQLRRPDSIMETLSQLWQQAGATAMWKATNATFIYNVLVKAVEGWTRNLLSALFDLPDPSSLASVPAEVVAGAMGGLDVADSPSPLASLGIAVAASAIAALLLAPLDLVRTRLILTPTTSQPRAILPNLRSLSSLTIPTSLFPITLLHSTLPTLLSTSTPLVLRQYLRIDPLSTPATYSLATFLTSTTELFIKLPLETVLRRAQIAHLKSGHKHAYNKAALNSFRGSKNVSSPDMDTIVPVGPYKGIFGTAWSIVSEEGIREQPPQSRLSTPARPGLVAKNKEKKGQGVGGLWRGWRVGMWGLVGVWGASALGGGGRTGGEF